MRRLSINKNEILRIFDFGGYLCNIAFLLYNEVKKHISFRNILMRVMRNKGELFNQVGRVIVLSIFLFGCKSNQQSLAIDSPDPRSSKGSTIPILMSGDAASEIPPENPIPTETSNFIASSITTGISYYISPNGNDSSVGSSNNPWKTIQKCQNVATTGDKCLVASGEYTTSTINITRPGITFECLGNCTTRKFTVSADNTTIRGFYITDTATSKDGFGISISSSGCVIENNHIFYMIYGGITLSPTSSDCIVRNNKLERNSQLGIEVNGRNNLIEGNEIWGSIQYHPRWTDPPTWVDADGIRFFGSGHIFRSNYIHDINYGVPENVNPHIDCFQTWEDNNHETVRNILFERNYCINQTAQSEDEQGQGFMIEGKAKNITIRNNIIQAFRGINSLKTSDLNVFNNLFIGNTTATADKSHTMAFFVDNNENVTFQNNIVYNYYTNIVVFGNNITGGKNLIYRSDGVYPIRNNIYNSPNDLWGVDPRFVNPKSGNYHLKIISPAIDAGYNLGSLVVDDFDGNHRPQGFGYDIGAFEMPTFNAKFMYYLPVVLR
jgi:hypothetical protein